MSSLLVFYKPKSSFVFLIFAACGTNGVNFILHNDISDKGNEDSENQAKGCHIGSGEVLFFGQRINSLSVLVKPKDLIEGNKDAKEQFVRGVVVLCAGGII